MIAIERAHIRRENWKGRRSTKAGSPGYEIRPQPSTNAIDTQKDGSARSARVTFIVPKICARLSRRSVRG